MVILKQLGFLVRVKKFFFPTDYDLQQKKLFEERVKFYNQFINQGDLCFDVGANYGNRTEVFLALNAKVLALEPQQSCFLFLKKKFGSKVTILQKGAGAYNEFLDFYINEKNSPVSTFSREWIEDFKNTRFAGGEWNKTERIEVVTLDSLIEKYGKPTFIKIDVEGFELEVLKGLTFTVPFLSFEYAVPERIDMLEKCLQQLNSPGNNLLVNYAKEENTSFELDEWIPVTKMLAVIHTTSFIDSYAGDIYVKNEPLRN